MRLIDADEAIIDFAYKRKNHHYDVRDLENILNECPTAMYSKDEVIKIVEQIGQKLCKLDFDFGEYYDHTDDVHCIISKLIEGEIKALRGENNS